MISRRNESACGNIQERAAREFGRARHEPGDVSRSFSESNFALRARERQFLGQCGEFFGAAFGIEIDPRAAKLRVLEINRLCQSPQGSLGQRDTRGRGSDGLRSASYDPQAPLRTAGLAKQGLNKLQRFDPLGLRFQDRVRASGEIAQVEARKMDDVAAVDVELEVPKIIRTCDDAILSLRLKMGRKRLSNAAAIGKDEPGRRLRTIGILATRRAASPPR